MVLKYLRALAWPAVTFAAIWTLRAQLRAAVARMTRVETLAGSIEFAAEVRDVLNQAESAADIDQSPSATYHDHQAYPPPWQQPVQPAPDNDDMATEEELASVPQQGDTAHSDRRYPPPPPHPQPGPMPAGPPTDTSQGPEPEPSPWWPRPQPQPSVPEEQPPWQSGYGYPPAYRLPAPPKPPALGGAADGADVSRPSRRFDALRNLRYVADASPLTAVLEAWEIIYSLSSDVIATFEGDGPYPQPSSRRSPATVGHRLELLGLSRESVAVFDRLRDLRNRAAHRATDVTHVAARDFVDSCLTLAREIEALANR